jgi:hypothetical protein
MAISRYRNNNIVKNSDQEYKKVFEERYGLSDFILQRKRMGIKYPDYETIGSLMFTFEIWQIGSRLHKISEKYYNDPSYWWLIGLYNKKPTDANYSVGDMVKVPLSLEEAFYALGI